MINGVDQHAVRKQLTRWGFWLRSAKSPPQSYTMSAMDSPLAKKRIVKPIYRDEGAENLDLIMSFHLDKFEVVVLELFYVKKLPNLMSAALLSCCVKTYTARRREAESILIGVLRTIQTQRFKKIA